MYNLFQRRRKKVYKDWIDYLLTSVASEQVMSVYQKLGYYKAVDKINELYSDEKISLIQKSKLNNEITEWQMMSSKQRKWHNKL